MDANRFGEMKIQFEWRRRSVTRFSSDVFSELSHAGGLRALRRKLSRETMTNGEEIFQKMYLFHVAQLIIDRETVGA
jgi:hypothetical protein